MALALVTLPACSNEQRACEDAHLNAIERGVVFTPAERDSPYIQRRCESENWRGNLEELERTGKESFD